MASYSTPTLFLLVVTRWTSACTFWSADTEFQGLDQRLVHLDLKGAPPKISYFVTLFPILEQLGATGILLEYEDMFPFHGPLKHLSRPQAYTKVEVQKMLDLAHQHHLEVVPLIQTFGHMEFVLKNQEFVSLREMLLEPYTICPSANESQHLIQAMVDQILDVHKRAKWLHIGCDEVFQLGKCNRCLTRMRETGVVERNRLFIDHVIAIARYVRAYAVQPIIWDDMLQSIPNEEIRKSGLVEQVVPMVWKYHRNVWNDLKPSLWEKYVSIFPRLWIASAFKGATGQKKQVANLRHYLENQCSWMEVVRAYGNRTQFLGIAVTGWQRYNHYTKLCELLPSGVPSLTIDLLYLKKNGTGSMDELLEEATKVLRCRKKLQLDRKRRGAENDSSCQFPGSDVLKGVLLHEKLKRDSRRRKVKNPQKLMVKARDLKDFVRRAFGEVFFNFTIDEWMDTYFDPVIDTIEKKLLVHDIV